ncbi:phytoene desaturase family protein [Paenibacillus methanolicus]|uniref:Phytoene dehydrogenase-like protein n=1 Tax=Paenibacillus methanolicus TaxID=582686 RepID=A0A5S5BY04_9BACL|nr:FAD-dependent oxidoreductase [Paenibacillus methanolicus]TYP70523.1 phytoene dehydrogenase-like protein [Paenibacillus methanolicus]
MTGYGGQPGKTIVIGGGLAGLMAAGRLAKAGESVVLLERSAVLGGRGQSVRRGEAWLNLGGHAFYKGGAFDQVLTGLNVKVTGAAPPSNRARLMWGGRLVSLPKLLASGSCLSLSGKASLAGMLLRMGRPASMPDAQMTLREYAERMAGDPAARHMLYALLRTASYTLDPDHQLARPVVRTLLRSFKDGLLYVDGGWQQIVDQLATAAVQGGADLRTGQPIAEVVRGAEGEGVRGVRLQDGTIVEADRVIMAVSPSECMRLVPGAELTVLRRWKEEARPSAVASLDLCLRKLPVPGRPFVLGIDQPLFFSNHSASARLSDDGSVVVHVTKYHGTEPSDPKADERMLEGFVDLAQPGWRKELIARQFLPRITVVPDYMHTRRTEINVGPCVPEVDGLFVAGDWASHDDELLADAAAGSAIRASDAIIAGRRAAGALQAIV